MWAHPEHAGNFQSHREPTEKYHHQWPTQSETPNTTSTTTSKSKRYLLRLSILNRITVQFCIRSCDTFIFMAASASSASQSQFTYSKASTYFPVPFHLQQPAAAAHYIAAPYAAAPAVQIPSPPVIGPVAPAPVAGVYPVTQYPVSFCRFCVLEYQFLCRFD